jgi:hypothetical protein
MELFEAAAFYKLGLLDYKKLKDGSSSWMESLPYSDSLLEVYTDSSLPNNISSAFEALLVEHGIKMPSKDEALKILIKLYLQMIVEGKCEPYEGMKFIDTELYRRAEDSKQEFVGQCLGLEHMYTWYRELQDAEDGSTLSYHTDLPKEEAVKKFKKHLQEEAKKLLETKYK